MSQPVLRQSVTAPQLQLGDPPAEIRVGTLGQTEPWQLSLLHDRPENTLIWVTRGQGRVVISGIRRGFGTHNALYLPAGTLFSLETGAQCLGLVVRSPVGANVRLPSEPLHLRVRDSLAQTELTAEIEAMQREFSKGRILLQEALEAHVGLLGVWLHRQLADGTADTPPRDSAGQRLVRGYAQAVARHYRTDRGVASYAEELGVTATHLTRACRAACGRTAVDMLAERKLHEARRLLSGTQMPVNRIAEALGFHSAPYFTRFMRNNTGLAPTDLRRGGHAAIGRSGAAKR